MQAHSIFWAKDKNLTKDSLVVLGAVFLLAISSQISIPLQPVPLTFQSITVLAIGMLLGSKRGICAVTAYLAAGGLGLPVFAELSAGVHVFFGPTGGYLIGFLPAVWVSGYLAEHQFFKTAALLGTAIIFGSGFIGLALLLNPEKAWLFGVKPFLLTEILKLILLVIVTPICWRNK